MTVKHLLDHVGTSVGASEGRHFKDTVFRSGRLHTDSHDLAFDSSGRLLIGVNCPEPGQSQKVHIHGDQDKAYLVQEGTGLFAVGDEEHEAGPGAIIWAPAGVPHGVTNGGTGRLVLLVAIAPAPGG